MLMLNHKEGCILTFGERLKSLRDDLDLNQSEVAHQLNILPKSLSNYELDLFEPSLSVLIQLARFYHVNVDYLLGTTDIRSTWEDFDKTVKIDDEFFSGNQIIDLLNKLDNKEKEYFVC